MASPFYPPRRTLMGPGPSDVNPRILEALGRPTIGHLDPAGPLPAWLVNKLAVDSPYSSLKNIKRIIADKKFQHQQFEFIREAKHDD